MKKKIFYVVGSLILAVLAFISISLSVRGIKNRGSANTVFAQSSSIAKGESSVNVSKESLGVIEALQNVSRAVCHDVLPSVVEIDVTETKKRRKTPFDDIPYFFFGAPRNDSAPEEYQEQGLGSGVIIRRKGKTYYVLTNNHVAGTATEISVSLNDGRRFDGKLVGADQRMDIALVSFESDDETIPLATLGNSDDVFPGDICYAMGAPLGYSQSVTQGIVSATGRSGNGIGNINDFIQTDAAINQGNSGGPLLNIYGQVIGINTWIASASGGSIGIGFAIPINNVKNAIDEFIVNGKITYGWIGVSLTSIREEYKESLGVKGKDGAFASQIFIDSPAQKAGLIAGDFIVELNGNKVKSVDQLVRDVAVLPVGEKVRVKVIRGGKNVDLTINVEERKDSVTQDDTKLWPGFIALPLTEDVKKQIKLTENIKGVAVANVIPKSPAASLRLQEGEVITAVNGKKVTNLQEFYAAIDWNNLTSLQFDVWSESGTITTATWKKN